MFPLKEPTTSWGLGSGPVGPESDLQQHSDGPEEREDERQVSDEEHRQEQTEIRSEEREVCEVELLVLVVQSTAALLDLQAGQVQPAADGTPWDEGDAPECAGDQVAEDPAGPGEVVAHEWTDQPIPDTDCPQRVVHAVDQQPGRECSRFGCHGRITEDD